MNLNDNILQKANENCSDDFDDCLENIYDQDDFELFSNKSKSNEQIEDVEKLLDDEFFEKKFEDEEKQKIEKAIQKVKNNANKH